MSEKTENLNIYQKLSKLRKRVEVIQKNKQGFNYRYVSEDEIYAKITDLMDKLQLSLVPMIVPGTTKYELLDLVKTKFDKKKDQYYEEHNPEIVVSADTVFVWINNENPDERVTVTWSMIGQQADSSQAFGSGLTYSSRYFLLKYFNCSTPEDDPDNWRSKQRAAEKAEDKALAEETIKLLDDEIKSFLEGHPDDKEKVKKLVTKYVKDGNYFAITESELAGKLLQDFRDKFKK